MSVVNKTQLINDLECCIGESKNCPKCSHDKAPTNKLCIIDLLTNARDFITELMATNYDNEILIKDLNSKIKKLQHVKVVNNDQLNKKYNNSEGKVI